MAQVLTNTLIGKRWLENRFVLLMLCVLLPCGYWWLAEELGSLKVAWLFNEALAAEKRCDLPQAEHLLRAALAEFRGGAKSNKEYARVEDRLAAILLHTKRPDEALKFYSNALEIRRKVMGSNAPETADSLNNVANCMMEFGLDASNSVQIESMFKQVLQIDELTTNGDSKYSAFTKGNLARLYGYRKGMASEAKCLFEESIQALKRSDCKEWQTATVTSNYADFLARTSNYPEAEKFYKEAVSAYEAAGAELHPHAIRSLQSLGKLYEHQSRHTEAQEVFGKVIALHAK